MKKEVKRMHCINCGKEYYQWHTSCSTCFRSNTIKVKDEYKPTPQVDEKDVVIDELISISLWSIRRLPTKKYREYALNDLIKIVGDNHKHSDFIKLCLKEVNDDN